MARESVINAVIGLCEAFGRTASDATVGAYEIGLKGLADEQVERAAALALQTCKFMPVPAELRELATGNGGFEAMAEKAFLALKDAMRTLGPDKSVNFADGLINATVRMHGGWLRVNEITVGDELDKWFRKEFIATYTRLCKTGASEDLRRYHGGQFERDNAGWVGRELPNGGTYELGMYGSEVVPVGVDYKPALPAPEPRRQLSASVGAQHGLELKRIGESR